MNKWQRIIDDLITVFQRQTRLVQALNNEYGEGFTNDAMISRIKSGETTKVYHEIGQALLIFHVRYVPIKDNNNNQGPSGDEVSTSS